MNAGFIPAKFYRTTEVPTVGPAWKTDQDFYLNKDTGVVGWIGLLVYVNAVGMRRVYVGAPGSGGSGRRALCVDN
jgi:hypothetical protein